MAGLDPATQRDPHTRRSPEPSLVGRRNPRRHADGPSGWPGQARPWRL